MDNLLCAWREFQQDKRKIKDVELFSLHLNDNILSLHHELKEKTYEHGSYQAFKINDPKPRDIQKASVRDRLIHHAIYRILYPYFDSKFIFDSYSCRRGKGTHKAINQFRNYARIVSQNNTVSIWVLKCDIKKFFATIDHKILGRILKRHISSGNTIMLLSKVVKSFHTEGNPHIGLPLGNLTSQLLVNIYMNEFDHFMKRVIKAEYYIRYADDFVILHRDKKYLEGILPEIANFLGSKLSLTLHPKKVSIKTLASGIDFLGWINFPHQRILRTSTKKRMFRNLNDNPKPGSLPSYLGIISHGDTHNLRLKLHEKFLYS